MASVTTWTRLEPLPRTGDLGPALEARVADPLWLLARQWQFGEFRGEDAGSPIVARVVADSARLTRYHAGKPGQGAAGAAVDYDDGGMPLEALVEAEAGTRVAGLVGAAAGAAAGGGGRGERLRAEAGMHFLRLLAAHQAGDERDAYVAAYAFDASAVAGSPDEHTAAFRALAAGRAPDGDRLYADLAAHRGAAASLESLPATPGVAPERRPQVLDAANRWMAWYESLLAEPAGEQAWQPDRLEYAFAVSASTAAGPVVLSCDEYGGGRLDWYSFDAAPSPSLGEAAPSERVVRSAVPTPVRYRGKPADRFWQFEDGEVAFGAAPAGPTDLARLLLVEFALVYGGDWFVLPVDLAVGSVCRITALEVTDTFGEVTVVGPSRDSGGRRWTMFEFSGPEEDAHLRDVFFLPPTVDASLDSEPLEEVALLRDEAANMVWAVERTVQGPTGDARSRAEEYQRAPGAGEAQTVDGDIGDAEVVYRLMTTVPDHWIPFLPVPVGGSGPGDTALELERRALLRTGADGVARAVRPHGRLLEPDRVLRIPEEEVRRWGATVRRAYQFARWTDGTGYLWVGRSKGAGRGEGSSGLRFDVARPPAPAPEPPTG